MSPIFLLPSLWLILSSLVFPAAAAAEISIDPAIQTGMVVQRGRDWQVGGTADSEQAVEVAFWGQRVSVQPAEGRWSARFTVPAEASGPAVLSVNRGQIDKQIMIGDVWVCSGQSNMAIPAARVADGARILQEARQQPIFLYQKSKFGGRERAFADRWLPVEAREARLFSAVCLAFGAGLSEELQVPVGLVDASLGGTPIEPWISRAGLQKLSSAGAGSSFADPPGSRAERTLGGGNHNREKRQPAILFETMIRPLGSQPIKGVLWYQGEGDRRNPEDYANRLSAMIEDWRRLWQDPGLPFSIVQLQGFGPQTPGIDPQSRWSVIRDAQRRVAESLPNTSLIVSYDLSDGNIHPGNKYFLGRRAARIVAETVYGVHAYDVSPALTGVEVGDGSVFLEFDEGSACIEAASDLNDLVFIAGPERRWETAETEVRKSGLRVWSANVPQPAAVRYAWSDFPRVGLRTCAEKIPLSPFRTDRW